jgi:hypothetical protein
MVHRSGRHQQRIGLDGSNPAIADYCIFLRRIGFEDLFLDRAVS